MSRQKALVLSFGQTGSANLSKLRSSGAKNTVCGSTQSNDNLPESVEFFGTNTRKIYADEFIDDRMVQGFNLPYYGEPKIKELTPEELFRLYQERYLDGRDPVINYRSHDTIPNAIVVEHHSGFESTFYTSIEMES